MALVDYSDSEESETEQTKIVPPPKPVSKPAVSSTSTFSVDRSNPQKIRVKLGDTLARKETHEDEPAPKKPRLGGGGFSGFNSLLPPPKRDADAKPAAKGPVRKVFSLKTGGEPGFSRESDAELKQLFTDQDTGTRDSHLDNQVGIANVSMTPTSTESSSQQSIKGNTFMFKPLSVARNSNKKKKAVNGSIKAATPSVVPAEPTRASNAVPTPPDPPTPKKVSLFSVKEDNEPEGFAIEPPEIDDIDPIPAADDNDHSAFVPPTSTDPLPTEPQDLNSIASDLNLSAAQRRQLFGRKGKGSASAINVANFNTDQEYLANEEIRATGEQVQHNPLRAIAPGKHSLKQLVNAAQGQKDALEESFAQGRRNKKEAGNKYGW